MDIQAQILPALAAIHNVILKHDQEDIKFFDDNNRDPNPADDQEKQRAIGLRDQIAQAMWDSYQEILRERGQMDE
ncbi:hypothetical protein C8R43DRAFT_1140319 [Mycena crocata]|nr:hypothetical protein C8R43DRAFT_1140319 [Mycena crocata]